VERYEPHDYRGENAGHDANIEGSRDNRCASYARENEHTSQVRRRSLSGARHGGKSKAWQGRGVNGSTPSKKC